MPEDSDNAALLKRLGWRAEEATVVCGDGAWIVYCHYYNMVERGSVAEHVGLPVRYAFGLPVASSPRPVRFTRLAGWYRTCLGWVEWFIEHAPRIDDLSVEVRYWYDVRRLAVAYAMAEGEPLCCFNNCLKRATCGVRVTGSFACDACGAGLGAIEFITFHELEYELDDLDDG